MHSYPITSVFLKDHSNERFHQNIDINEDQVILQLFANKLYLRFMQF